LYHRTVDEILLLPVDLVEVINFDSPVSLQHEHCASDIVDVVSGAAFAGADFHDDAIDLYNIRNKILLLLTRSSTIHKSKTLFLFDAHHNMVVVVFLLLLVVRKMRATKDIWIVVT
jgi:hypothetical protein